MLLGALLVGAAAGLLWLGAELFVAHAAAAGRRLGTTALAVGLLFAGAEPEELITAVIAALRGRGGIAAGDAIGANVTMLTLVLGLAALVGRPPLSGRVRRYLIGAAALGTVAAVLLPGGVGRLEGSLLVLLYVLAVGLVWIRERAAPPIGELSEIETEAEPRPGGARGLLLAVAGIAVMAVGGWLAVVGAEHLVQSLGVADSTVGLSVVALATTAELLALVWAAHRRRVTELAVAGVVGSVGYNATMTLGVAALANPIGGFAIGPAAWLAVCLPVLIAVFGVRSGNLTRWQGGVLVGIYAAYLLLLYA